MNDDTLMYPRGSIWKCNCSDILAEEGVQAGTRPALIISSDSGNSTAASVIVAFITSNIDRAKYSINVGFTNADGAENVILCNQIRTIHKKNLVRFMGFVTPKVLDRVDKAIKISLNLKESSLDLSGLEEVVQNVIDKKITEIQDHQPVVTQDAVNNIAAQIEKLFTDVLIPLDNKLKQERKEGIAESAPIASTLVKGHTELSERGQVKAEPEPEAIKAKPEIIKAEQTQSAIKQEPEKVEQRKHRGFWTDEKKMEFIQDKENMPLSKVVEKWHISSKKSAYQMYYTFKRYFEDKEK